MIDLIKKIFNLQKKISNRDKLEYKSTSILGKKQDLAPIPKINIPANNLKNILILDDNFEAGEITYYDIIFLFDLSEKRKRQTPRGEGMQTEIKQISLREVLHFLGWHGSPLEPQWISTLHALCERVKKEVHPRVIFRRFPIESGGRLRKIHFNKR